MLVFNGNAGDRSLRAPLAEASQATASVFCCSTIAGTAVIWANRPKTAWRVTPVPRVRISTRDRTWIRSGSCTSVRRSARPSQ